MTRTCAACGGTGIVGGMRISCGPMVRGQVASTRDWCIDCDGKGWQTDGDVERMDRARKLRADRLARDLSLREEAKRLGISAAQLSAMERGVRGAENR